MRLLALCLGLATAVSLAHGQERREVHLPCAYSGVLLQTGSGEIVRYTSNKMKARAIAKRDVDDSLKQVDLRVMTMLDLLVGPDDSVICAKTIIGLTGFSSRIEQALKAWRFRPVLSDGTPVSYLGRIQFSLCNVDCGKAGNSMTLLK
jgi:hypothetical protein